VLQAHGSCQNNLGVLSGFRHMLREGGVASLWRGNGINVVKIMPEAALKFALYDQVRGIDFTQRAIRIVKWHSRSIIYNDESGDRFKFIPMLNYRCRSNGACEETRSGTWRCGSVSWPVH
jgi:hypothetical protein